MLIDRAAGRDQSALYLTGLLRETNQLVLVSLAVVLGGEPGVPEELAQAPRLVLAPEI